MGKDFSIESSMVTSFQQTGYYPACMDIWTGQSGKRDFWPFLKQEVISTLSVF